VGPGDGRNEAMVAERDNPRLRRFQHGENCRGRLCNQRCGKTGADALTGIGMAGRIRRRRVVVPVSGRSLSLGRTGMEPLDTRPRDTRSQEYHGECDGSAAPQPR
jgi:hypothetical protein